MTLKPLSAYDQAGFYCEMLGKPGTAKAKLSQLWERLLTYESEELEARASEATGELLDLGITFTVYSDRDAIDRILPFDIIPRVLSAADWQRIEAGVTQRVAALNLLLEDLYGEGRILKDGVVPSELVLANANFRKEMVGYRPPQGTFVHVAGVDLIRDEEGTFLVLEDNARTPSGVSYVVENRHLM